MKNKIKPNQNNKSFVGIFFLGVVLILYGIALFVQYEDKGYIAHTRFNFNETGTSAVVKIASIIISGVMAFIYGIYLVCKSNKKDKP